MRVWFLVESWLHSDGFRPVGVWYVSKELGFDIWFEPEYDRMVRDYEFLGPLSQQWANYFAHPDRHYLDLHDPSILDYWAGTGGQRIDRAGPFELEVDEIKPVDLIEAVRTGEALHVPFAQHQFESCMPVSDN